MTESDEEQAARLRAERDRYRERLREREEQLASQPPIEQAKGILRNVFALGEQDAFTVLVRLSQQSNVKLRDIATELVYHSQGMASSTTDATAATVADVVAQVREQLGHDQR